MTIKTVIRTVSVMMAAAIPITLTACQQPPRAINDDRSVTFIIEKNEDGSTVCRYAQVRSLSKSWDDDALQSGLRDMTINVNGNVSDKIGPGVGDSELDFPSQLKKLGIDPTTCRNVL